jgi:HSP20 family protein
MAKPQPAASSRPSTSSEEAWRVRREDAGAAAPAEDASLRLHGGIGRLFDEASDRLRQQRRPDATVWAAPRIGITETEREVRIRAELPDRSENDVAVALDGREVTIRGKAPPAAAGNPSGAGGSFARSIRVPWRIEPDKVTVGFEDGVLTVVLPKPADGGTASSPMRGRTDAGSTAAAKEPERIGGSRHRPR